VDGYEVRRVKHDSEKVDALFCHTCVVTYDRLAMSQTGDNRCSRCGTPIPEEQARLRSANQTELIGAVAWSRTVYAVLCPRCAEGIDGDSDRTSLMTVLVLLGFLLLGLACWLFT
jgi:hypothetical protein